MLHNFTLLSYTWCTLSIEISVRHTSRSRSRVVHAQIVNEAQPLMSRVWLSLIDNEGELSNFFSINQLAGQNIILKKWIETSVKCESFAIECGNPSISLLVVYSPIDSK